MNPFDLEELDTAAYAWPADGTPDLNGPSTARPYKDGGSFIFDTPDTPPAVWGSGEDVLWAEGEALTIYGGSGVGKTTIAGQLVRSLILGDGPVLGHPVTPATGRVLYLAMDRPRQAARSLARQFHPSHRGILAERLTVWPGPPPEDMAKRTGLMVQMCREAGASHVVVDSLKDAAVGLSEDAVGAGYNRARQAVLADGVQVLELHHQIKARADGVKGIDQMYGSTWIAAGAGSVLYLEGQPGDAVVKLRHLKQPAAEVGPFDVMHDDSTGLSTVVDDADPLALVRARGSLEVSELASILFATDAPDRNQVEKARRKLETLARKGLVTRTPTTLPSGASGPTKYTPGDPS